MKKKRIGVGCDCGWRGRRVPGTCDNDFHDGSGCSCYLGRCPKCQGRLFEPGFVRQHLKMLKESALGAGSYR